MSEVIKKEKVGDLLGDRMKNYENITRNHLIPNMPVIVRVDGRAFHSYTKQKWCEFPYSHVLISVFHKTTLKVCEETSNVVFAYHQSDEVTFLLKDYERRAQQQVFQGNIQKITSTFASKFTAYFNKYMEEELSLSSIGILNPKLAEFDARVFNIPIHEVINCFIWRQKDWEKNSVTQYASSFFSHTELMNKNTKDKHDMIYDAGHPSWNDLGNWLKRGTFFKKVEVDLPIKELSEEQIKYLSDISEIEEPIIRKKWIVDYNSPILVLNKEYLQDIVEKIEEE